ncbi:septum formation protein Maf [Patescibacteria group bacterium]|nr:septum formation protein Maf [Patescibacteria group bacterium]
MQKLILASASPQRSKLLESLGLPFDAIPSEVDEALCQEEDPETRAITLARLKAEDVSKKHTDAWVIGSDTLVVSPQGYLLEKPTDEAHAREMLEHMSGGVSLVHSGLCLIGQGDKVHEGISTSHVRFRQLSKGDIDWWISTGLWEGRSGSFQIEGQGQMLVEELKGDWSGVVGLPLYLLGDLMRKADIEMKNE